MLQCWKASCAVQRFARSPSGSGPEGGRRRWRTVQSTKMSDWHMLFRFLSFTLCLAASAALPEAGRQPCQQMDIHRPERPEMIEVDLALLMAVEGQPELPEWSKIEKLQTMYRAFAAESAPCELIEGEEAAFQLFISRQTLESDQVWKTAGRIAADGLFQFYGASRIKVERADRNITREVAYPVGGSAAISEVAGSEQLPVLLEDLAQVQLVSVPRIRRLQGIETLGEQAPTECFVVSDVTLTPSRVFDEPNPAALTDPSSVDLSLAARRRSLERIARETRWRERLATEQPGCRVELEEGLLGRQITSLNLTTLELVPDVDFVTEAIRFWREVEQRVARLRAEEESWKKELSLK